MTFKKGCVPWCAGLTKETDSRLLRFSEEYKGHIVSEETKRKIGEANKGNKPWLGKHLSEEHKKKISDANKGHITSEETKKKLSNRIKGRKQSEETKNKHRELILGKKNPMYGKLPWSSGLTKETSASLKSISDKLKGRKLSQEWKDKLSKARIGKYAGENHPNWQGGLKDNPYSIEFNEKLRKQIRERDGNKCVLCGGVNKDRELQAHHIDYDKMNNINNNLFSLCLTCHVKTNFNREYWKSFFIDLIWFYFPNSAEIYTTINNINNEGGDGL